MNPVLLTLVLVLCNSSSHKCTELPHPVLYAPARECQTMVRQFIAREAKAHPDWMVREARCVPVA
jgi:hypothetical protein